MSQTLSNELRGVIERHVRTANAQQLLAITSTLCVERPQIEAVAATMGIPRSQRFEVSDQTVFDRRTGLMWTRKTMPGGRTSWAKAKEACSLFDLDGYSDWRLPTIRELLSLVDYERHDPAIDTSVFQCEAAWYWSSTPLASSPGGCAWLVDFDGGCAGWYGQDGGGFVRACRAGQSIENWF